MAETGTGSGSPASKARPAGPTGAGGFARTSALSPTKLAERSVVDFVIHPFHNGSIVVHPNIAPR